jgi:predicted PurR-regulated permease PerM
MPEPQARLSLPEAGPARRHIALHLPEPLMMAVRLAIVAIVVAGLYAGKDILVPLALAALLAFLLDPLVGRLRRLRVPRSVAVGIVTLATLLTMAGGSLLVGQQVVQLGRDLPQYQSTIEHKLRALRQRIAGDPSLHSATRLIDSVGHEMDATRKALEVPGPAPRGKAVTPVPVQVAAPQVSSLKALHDALMPVVEPLLSGGIAVVLLIFILLERNDLRDRVMRLVGGDLHHMTDALNEAALRVSRYLTMQVVVNGSYGVPLTLGLWWIGVPGALLWGLLAALLRFIPYLGPVLASVFPLALAFAVDPGWDMLLWTAALILTLELISNNLIEPWLYGSSTGLAPVAILLSAAFWTVLWGTAGLILATPLTVCLVVMGRHLPQLRFLDLLLGSDPVFDAPTRLYQRLLSGSVEEASDLAESEIAEAGLTAFYSGTALPALGMAAADHSRVASAEHRHRVATGMGHLLQEIRHDHPADAVPDGTAALVLCIALRWEADALASAMLAHALQVDGMPAQDLPAGSLRGERLAALGVGADGVLCLSSFHPDPEALARHACRRLQRLQPGLKIVLGLWHAPPALREPGAAAALGATAVATSLQEAVAHVQALLAEQGLGAPTTALTADADTPASAEALALCRQLDTRRAGPSLQAAQRAAEIFDTAHGVVCWADDTLHSWQAGSQTQAVGAALLQAQLLRPLLNGAPSRVVPDSAREPSLGQAASGASGAAGADAAPLPHRFMAAVPLRWDGKQVVGSLCLLDGSPRSFSARDLRLLEALASDLVQLLRADAARPAAVPSDVPPLLPPGGAVLAG